MSWFMIVMAHTYALWVPIPYPTEAACKAAVLAVEKQSKDAPQARTSTGICLPAAR